MEECKLHTEQSLESMGQHFAEFSRRRRHHGNDQKHAGAAIRRIAVISSLSRDSPFFAPKDPADLPEAPVFFDAAEEDFLLPAACEFFFVFFWPAGLRPTLFSSYLYQP